MHEPPRRWLAGLLAVAVVAGLLIVILRRPHSAPGDGGSGEHIPALGPEAVTIIPGVHLLGGLAPAAAYVVETSAGLVLIDAGLDRDAGPLKREMAKLGLDWRQVRAIFLTHVHGDHCGGAEHLRSAAGSKVYAGRGDADVLRAGRPREAFFSTFSMPEATIGPTTVDVELSGEQPVTIGDVAFQAVCTPGHTPGSVCYFMEKDGRRVLFSGDVVWSLSAGGNPRDPLSRPLGTYTAYLPPLYRGDVDAFLATLRRLAGLPPPQIVLPGHPRNDRVPMSPVVTPARWQTLLGAGIREMEQLQAHYAADGRAFLDGHAKKLLPDLYYLGDFHGGAVYALVATSKLVLIGAPGGKGIAQFMQNRLKELGVKATAPAAVLLTSEDAEETAGLAELVEKYHPQVVALPAAWERLKNSCPAGTVFVPAAELPQQGWFPVRTIPLTGRGVAPAAYLMPWDGKSVLFTGRVPQKISRANAADFAAEFSFGQGNVTEYLDCVGRLAEIKPNVWLPAVPVEGQNANLYDGEWQEVLKENRLVLQPRK